MEKTIRPLLRRNGMLHGAPETVLHKEEELREYFRKTR